MKNDYEIVRAACIKANPEILELKVGCEVEYNDEGKVRKDVIVGFAYEHTDSKALLRKYACNADSFRVGNFKVGNDGFPYVAEKVVCDTYCEMMQYTRPISSIIGRPIHLADVLLTNGIELLVMGTGQLFTKNDIGRLVASGVFWNLREDDLSKQSPECLSFLTTLLDPTKEE